MRSASPISLPGTVDLWERVSNPLARQLIEGVFGCVPFKETLDRTTDYLSMPSAEILAYRKQLRERLERSGLAEALAGGLDLLPDIYPLLPQPLALYERLIKPRGYRQLGPHLVRYLDWYLAPKERVHSELVQHRMRAIWCVTLITLLSVITIPIFGSFAILLAIASAVAFFASYVTSAIGQPALIDLNAVRVSELLFYLIDSYEDSDPDRLEVEAFPASLLQEKFHRLRNLTN